MIHAIAAFGKIVTAVVSGCKNLPAHRRTGGRDEAFWHHFATSSPVACGTIGLTPLGDKVFLEVP
ncbi:MAG: hypothetical protein KF847_02690 [Pirellulales bacterium]|nr:hypothetical protein [Pirellulales bacterium]